MLQIRDQTVRGQTVELGNRDLNCLGPGLTLEDCTVVFRTAANGLVLNDVRFVDCALEVKRKLNNFPFYAALLRGCRVTGALTGCSFGHWPDYFAQGTKHGGVECCDFSGATLENCQFVDCDMNRVKLPTWPHFTLLDAYSGPSRSLIPLEADR